MKTALIFLKYIDQKCNLFFNYSHYLLRFSRVPLQYSTSRSKTRVKECKVFHHKRVRKDSASLFLVAATFLYSQRNIQHVPLEWWFLPGPADR